MEMSSNPCYEYSSPEEILASLETTTSNENGESLTDDEKGVLELKIDFDPPTPRILVRSPEDIPIGGGGPRRSYEIDSGALSRFLDRQQRNHWTKLYLNKVHLLGDPGHSWRSSLEHVQSLRARFCNINPNAWLNQLSHLPLLQSLVFIDVWGGPNGVGIMPTLPAVTNLLHFRRDTLQELCINNLQPDNAQFQSFFEALQGCTALKRLDISPHRTGFTQEQLESFANLVKTTHSLEVLELSLQHAVSLVPLAEGLAHNKSRLRELRISELGVDRGSLAVDKAKHRKHQELDAFQEVLANNNFDLTDLYLGGSFLPQSGNCFLHRWNVVGEKGTKACKSIEFNLLLNRLGRKMFVVCNEAADGRGPIPKREDWVEIIVANREDVSVVFYFLQLNPSIYVVE